MWVKVLKSFSSALEGELLELKDGGQHQLLIDQGFIEVTEAPIVEEAKPVTTEAYSTASVLKGATSAPANTNDSALLETAKAELEAERGNLEALKGELEAKEEDLNNKATELQNQEDALKVTIDGVNADREKLNADITEFETAKAEFETLKSATAIVEPGKGKPDPKPKEDK